VTTWRERRRPQPLDLTSLIDVVFTLLLVVVLGSKFGPPVVDLNLPSAAHRGAEAPSQAVSVSLKADGTALVDGVVVADADVVARVLTKGASGPVVLGAEAKVPYERAFHVLDGLTQAGVKSLSLSYDQVR
jgi:biopolymer transport protein ExbD